jgi:hypothetical protein
MVCTDDLFIDRWIKHIDGAATIIGIRGSEQLTRRVGLDLFTYLRTRIVCSPYSGVQSAAANTLKAHI